MTTDTLPKGWTDVALGDLCSDVRSGFASGDDLEEGVLQLRMNNVSAAGRMNFDKQRRVGADDKQLRTFSLVPGDVLFNATNSAEMVGKTALFTGREEPVVFSNHFLRLRCEPATLDPAYLARWLTLQFERRVFEHGCRRWVNQATYDKPTLLGLRLPLPPIEEQRRIAAVLDQADELRANRRAALALLDTLTEAIFLDMFGDPMANTRGWDRVPMRSAIERIESGNSPVCLPHPPTPGEWGVLKLGAVTTARYRDTQSKALPLGSPYDPSDEVHSGDLLFSRKNTLDLVGASAYVWSTRPRLLLSDLIFRLVPSPHRIIHPVYLHQLLTYGPKRREVQRLAGGSAGSMPNISKARLLEFPIEVPPISLQETFAGAAGRIEQQRVHRLRAEATNDELFASLQQRAFRGEL